MFHRVKCKRGDVFSYPPGQATATLDPTSCPFRLAPCPVPPPLSSCFTPRVVSRARAPHICRERRTAADRSPTWGHYGLSLSPTCVAVCALEMPWAGHFRIFRAISPYFPRIFRNCAAMWRETASERKPGFARANVTS